ncbi:MAG: tRNA uridine-5-carboxymethylaminomethyl(34) synthesis GTPase MnmE [Candidatus Omnitrophota bacterium]
MINVNLEDTIVAISTPIGEGGIGIVRISGKDAVSIAEKIFISKDKRKASQFKTYTTHYGHIVAPSSAGEHEVIDEVILTIMLAPKSYTKEDIVEINCHGGIIPLKKTLELVMGSGVRLANPGEFTMRAFLNGRIDLSQAEAVLDIIRAKTDEGLRLALNQLAGDLSKEINKIRDEIINIQVDLEASIDFPEEELEVKNTHQLLSAVENIERRLKILLDTADCGAIIRNGITTVISGKPNVGKSSLFNALARKDRAIVTPIAGTTRDVIEEVINIAGIPLVAADTAGIADSEHPIEKEGVKRSRLYLNRADLVLLVFDASMPLSGEDYTLMEQVNTKNTIAVVNKIDLPQKIEIDKIQKQFCEKTVKISATEGDGLDTLKGAIKKIIWDGHVIPVNEAIVTSARHKNALLRAHECAGEARAAVASGVSAELVVPLLRDALDSLGEIIGETVTEDILNRIFEQFCIGK